MSREGRPQQNISLEGFQTFTRRLIMTAELNAAGKLFGGILLAWIDESAALFTMSTMRTRRLVTKKVSEVIFNSPAHLGDIIEFMFKQKAIGISSTTIECVIVAQAVEPHEQKRLILQCDFVFVCINELGKPTPWPTF